MARQSLQKTSRSFHHPHLPQTAKVLVSILFLAVPALLLVFTYLPAINMVSYSFTDGWFWGY
jgi:hypothetical protein